MPFTIPNESDAAFPSQAAPDSTDIAAITAASERTGVVSGCAVTAQGTPDMTVAVAAGTVSVAGVTASVSAGNVTIGAADGTNPRKDIVVVSNAGAKSVVAGTAASDPVKPAIPADSVLLAEVYVPASDTDIDADQITDKRAGVLNEVFRGAKAYLSGAHQAIPNNSSTPINLNAESYDTDSLHDNATNNSRIVLNQVGYWMVVGQVQFSGHATGERDIRILRNGASVGGVGQPSVAGNTYNTQAASVVRATAITDYVEVAAYQTSGGNLNVHFGEEVTFLQAHFIGA